MFIFTKTKTETWNKTVETNATDRNLWWNKGPKSKPSSRTLAITEVAVDNRTSSRAARDARADRAV